MKLQRTSNQEGKKTFSKKKRRRKSKEDSYSAPIRILQHKKVILQLQINPFRITIATLALLCRKRWLLAESVTPSVRCLHFHEKRNEISSDSATRIRVKANRDKLSAPRMAFVKKNYGPRDISWKNDKRPNKERDETCIRFVLTNIVTITHTKLLPSIAPDSCPGSTLSFCLLPQSYSAIRIGCFASPRQGTLSNRTFCDFLHVLPSLELSLGLRRFRP